MRRASWWMPVRSVHSARPLLTAALLAACGGGDGTVTPPSPSPTVRSVTVVGAASMRVGDRQPFTASVDAGGGATTAVTWSSESPAVATVSADGVVSAVAPGTATIRATSTAAPSVSGTLGVTVRAARSITLSPLTATISVGATQAVTAAVQLDPGESTTLIWRSSTPAAATVSATGVVTGVSLGTALITALAAADTTVRASMAVTVASLVRSIAVAPAAVTLATGTTQQLTATVVADPGLVTTVTWRSSAPAVATVSATGLVAGVSLGTTVVTAISTADTTVRASVNVVVAAAVRAVTVTPTAVSLFSGVTQQLTAAVTADAGLATTVTWRSSAPAVATVSATGLVTAIGPGTASVTALANADTTRRASSAITVNPRPIVVTIAPRVVGLVPGATLSLAGSVSADPGVSTAVTWSSATPSVATVSAQGVVTALAAGTTLVTAASQADPMRRDTVTVAVRAPLATAWSASRLAGPLVEDILGVLPVDATTAFAINGDGDIFRWNGSAWARSADASAFGTGTRFLALHGSTASQLLAVGTNGVIARWSGGAWTAMASGTVRTLTAVFVENAAEAWAVGAQGTVLRLTGGVWSGEASGTTATLNAVWSGDNVVVAVGNGGVVRRRTGTTWGGVAVPSTEHLTGVHGVGANNVVVVGEAGTLLRWNGTAWSALPTAGYAGSFFGITGSAANGGRRFVVGDDGLAQLDSTVLAKVATPYAPRLFSVALDAAGTPWTGGQRGLVMRGTGGSATTLNMAPDLQDVWAVNATTAWAVGDFGSIYRWNGTTWSREATPVTGTLFTVWAANATTAFAAGADGAMLRWNGTAWSTLPFPGTGAVSALWGSGPTNVVATTSAGEVLVFNGTAWQLVQSVAAPLWSVWGTAATETLVTGEQGTVQELRGTAWNALTAPTSATLAGSWSTGPGRHWVVGAAADGVTGVAFRLDGGSWSTLSMGTSAALAAVWGPGQADLYAVGDRGTLLRFDGTRWGAMASGTTDLLWSISGVPGVAGSGVAVGYNSTVVRGTSGTPITATDRDPTPVAGTLDPLPGARAVRRPLPTGALRRRKGGR